MAKTYQGTSAFKKKGGGASKYLYLIYIERYTYVLGNVCGYFKYLIIQRPDLVSNHCFFYSKIMSITPEILETGRNVCNLPPVL